MGQTLTEIADTLRGADKKVQLIYAFNASGKTRLSRAFRELIDPKTEERDDDYRPNPWHVEVLLEPKPPLSAPRRASTLSDGPRPGCRGRPNRFP